MKATGSASSHARSKRMLKHAWLCTSVVLVLLDASDLVFAQLCGDTDGGGQITVSDGVNVLRSAAGLTSTCSIATCDVDGNGQTSVSDGVNVLRAAAQLPVVLACVPTIAIVGEPVGTVEGRVFLSADLGGTWESIPNPASNTVAGGPAFPVFAFVDRSTGFSVDGAAVRRTTDGGRTWSLQPGLLPLPSGGRSLGIAFEDASNGIAGGTVTNGTGPFYGQSPLFFYTTDAGVTWQAADTSPTGVMGIPQQICTAAHAIGVALGTAVIGSHPRPPLLMVTRDGGRHWQSVLEGFPGVASPTRMDCVGEATIWVATESSELFRSIDGGASWEAQTPTLPAEVRDLGIAALDFVDERHGALLAGDYGVGAAQRYVVTGDGSETWRTFPLPGPVGDLEATTTNSALAFAGGTSDSEVFVTRTGGETWHVVMPPPGIGHVDDVSVIPH